MYQQKIGLHRTILNGVDYEPRTVSANLAQAGHVTLSTDSVVSDNVAANRMITIALDKISARNVLVSVVATMVGLTSSSSTTVNCSPFRAITWVSENLVEAAQDNFAALPTTFAAVGDNTVVSTECDFLVPILDTADDEVQYVTVLLGETYSEWRFTAQMTAYSSEYDFWQPTK